MANQYYKRYYDNHDFKRQSVVTKESVSRSNSMYDVNKGFTHTFLHTDKGSDDDSVRLIGDVEICMSQDPAVTSQFSPMYRNNLRNGLISAKGNGPTGLTDEQLMQSVPCNVRLERDEAVAAARQNIDEITLEAKRFQRENHDTSTETPPETPSGDTSSTPPAVSQN